jgi:hypothetical protein
MKNLPYQDTAVERYKGKKYFGLLFDCGTGKTRTTIKIAEADAELDGGYKAVLVIAPRILEDEWKSAVELHGEMESSVFVAETSRMKRKGVQQQFEEFLCRNRK